MEENDFTSLGSYIESIKPIIESEYSFLKSNDWTEDDLLETIMPNYDLELDIVSTAVGHIKNMSQYKKAETKLFKKWYAILVKFFDLHEERANKFLGNVLEITEGKTDSKTKKMLGFRRTISKELAKMNVIINKSKANSKDGEGNLPRIKNDTPIPIVFMPLMEKNFPILKEKLDKRKKEYFEEQKNK